MIRAFALGLVFLTTAVHADVQTWSVTGTVVTTPSGSGVTYYPGATYQVQGINYAAASAVPSNISYTIPAMPAFSVTPGPADIAPYASISDLDRLASAAETSDELRVVMARYDRLNVIRSDALLKQFIRERFAAPELTPTSGLSVEYRNWLLETLFQNGDRMDPSLSLPNFRLLPVERAASWPSLYARSFRPLQSRQPSSPLAMARVVVMPIQGHHHDHFGLHAHMRAAPAFAAVVVARPTAGEELRLLGQNGDWYYVETGRGVTGYIYGAQLSFAVNSPMYTGAESAIRWANPANAGQGYDSNYGWVYPNTSHPY